MCVCERERLNHQYTLMFVCFLSIELKCFQITEFFFQIPQFQNSQFRDNFFQFFLGVVDVARERERERERERRRT